MPLMRKVDFAALTGTHRSRVSHWIRDCKISGAAIVGQGRKALIDVDVALRQLRERLDVDGLVRTGLNTNLYPAPAKPAAPKAKAPVVDLLHEIALFEAAGWRIARALVSAGWPTTEREAWDALMQGLNELDEQQLDAAEAAGAA